MNFTRIYKHDIIRMQFILPAFYAVIYITEDWAQQLTHVIDKYKDQMLPAVIQIPGVSGNTGEGVENVKKFVEQAVGSDILFSQNS